MSCSSVVCTIAIAVLTLAAAIAAAGEPQRLTHDGHLKMDPVFVNQGREIVYTVLESPTQTVLRRLRLEGGSDEPLHPKASTAEFEAAFSSDDRYCAYVQSRGNLSLRLVIHDTRNDEEHTLSRRAASPASGIRPCRWPAGGSPSALHVRAGSRSSRPTCMPRIAKS